MVWSRRKIQTTPKIISTATMEGTRESVRPREKWRDEVQEDLNIMGIKKRERRSGVQEDCKGCQGPQRTVAPEEKKE